ncbi:MAG: hypothetical protein FWB92_02875 [Oscillospiraceae bacterium]|nr:hypothetical protein [Oscillospiraceae bacterium]
MGKKHEGRYTLNFDLTDPVHIQGKNILDATGSRRKADKIAKALMFYEQHGTSIAVDTPKIIHATVPAMPVAEAPKIQAPQGDFWNDVYDSLDAFGV